MSDPTQPKTGVEGAPADAAAPEPSRRRVLRGGLAAAPVLMTLVSRPVLGGHTTTERCTTPSGFVSANASTAGRGVACEGRTPSYWKSRSNWPAPYTPGTKFNDVFSNPAYTAYKYKTLLDVLGMTGGPPGSVAAACVAALLNAQSQWTPPLQVSAVKDIWSEYSTKGYYSPCAGAKWNAGEILDYLSTTGA